MSCTDGNKFLERELETGIFFNLIFNILEIGLLMRVLLIGKGISDLSEAELHLKTIENNNS